VNNSKRPLLLLAGEIVTGGKQDRVIAKDRIVPAGGDPIDLSVFCIEHGRWTESSEKFGATAKTSTGSFMVQPTVRQEAMVAKGQQQVWNSVNGAISTMAVAAAPAMGMANSRGSVSSTAQLQPDSLAVHGSSGAPTLPTTSYAKAMQTQAVSAKVDETAAGLVPSREQALASLRQEHAVGVVVALHGEVIVCGGRVSRRQRTQNGNGRRCAAISRRGIAWA
jgi:ARG and Rhodanese-Phosphatase-superfamily-associated Protein domain